MHSQDDESGQNAILSFGKGTLITILPFLTKWRFLSSKIRLGAIAHHSIFYILTLASSTYISLSAPNGPSRVGIYTSNHREETRNP